MPRLATPAALAAPPALAHGFAGAHMFVSTLIIDDPNVADETSLPTLSFQPQTGGGAAYAGEFEFDKTTTFGVVRNFARTGANGGNGAMLDNDDSGSTAPTIYFGKGLGDLPIGWARALAITGELAYQVAGKMLKVIDDRGDFNNGTWTQWSGGLSPQYSIRYLSTQVKDLGLPEWMNKLTPLVEVAWSSPASRPNQGATQYVIAPGINYTATDYALSVEALIPGNRPAGSHVGVIAQFHLYFDDMLPNSLGKPLLHG